MPKYHMRMYFMADAGDVELASSQESKAMAVRIENTLRKIGEGGMVMPKMDVTLQATEVWPENHEDHAFTVTVVGSMTVEVRAATAEEAIKASYWKVPEDDTEGLNLDTWSEHPGKREVYDMDGEEYVPEED